MPAVPEIYRFDHSLNKLAEENYQLRAENERLKAEQAEQAERIKELSEQCRTNHSMELDALARERDELAAQNQKLRDLLNHFRDDVLFRIGINSPYRTDVVAPYYERIKKTLATFES